MAVIRTESDLNKALREKIKTIWSPLRRDEKKPMWHRIENAIGAGTFDTFIGSEDGSGWIELKCCGPKAKPDMRQGQPAFGLMCRSAGVPAHVLCCASGGYLKLLNGWTFGLDWRDHLVMEAHLDDMKRLHMVLLTCMGRDPH